MYKNFPSLAEAFLNYFDVELANTPKQREQIERIRYRVYCREFGYEPADAFPNLREKDEYDDHSLHCLISHRRSGRPAGCVRLICASDDHSLPLEDHCIQSMHVEYLKSLGENREDLCEFSRLAVDYTFRKRPGEEHTRFGEYDAVDCCHQEQRTFHLVGIAAFLSAFAMAELAGREQVFAMMESNLPRLLRRAGILVQEAGDTVDYHGQRAAYFITTHLAVQNMREDVGLLYESIRESLARDFCSPPKKSAAIA